MRSQCGWVVGEAGGEAGVEAVAGGVAVPPWLLFLVVQQQQRGQKVWLQSEAGVGAEGAEDGAVAEPPWLLCLWVLQWVVLQ